MEAEREDFEAWAISQGWKAEQLAESARLGLVHTIQLAGMRAAYQAGRAARADASTLNDADRAFLADMRGFEQDHEPSGRPVISMRDVSRLCDIVERLAAQAAAVKVPDGFALVPLEPTEFMFIEGMEADCLGRPSVDDDSHVRSIWSAMVAAAAANTPTPTPTPGDKHE